MNIQTLSKNLDQKYIKDINSSAGKVGPYFFIMEPTNQTNLARISFSVLGAQEILSQLQETVSVYRAVGRDGIRASHTQVIIECKLGGLEHPEELATILESVATTLHQNNIVQVDSEGNASDHLGVYRIGTKLEVQTDTSVQEISETVGERYKSNNESRLKAYLHGFGLFLLLGPVYILISMYEPSIFGFTIFSFIALIWMFKKSLSEFLKYLSPTKIDLIVILLFYIFALYSFNLIEALIPLSMSLIKMGHMGLIFELVGVTIPMSGGLLINSLITLAFAVAYNYHIVASLVSMSKSGNKQIKRSIHRVL